MGRYMSVLIRAFLGSGPRCAFVRNRRLQGSPTVHQCSISGLDCRHLCDADITMCQGSSWASLQPLWEIQFPVPILQVCAPKAEVGKAI